MIANLKNAIRLTIAALIAFGITACGFHLKGEADIPARLKILTLTSESGSDHFDRSLRIALLKAGIVVIDQAQANPQTLNLKINPLTSSDTELARDSNNDVSQLQRRISSYYFIRQPDGKSIYGPRHISTTETLTNQNAEESSKLSYNQAQTQRMYESLAEELVNDLSYVPR